MSPTRSRQPTRRSVPTLASPVLIGAVTVLVAVVAVFLAYNANAGLPFVPTYQIRVVVPNAAELVPGNDVRIAGSRVGVVSGVSAEETRSGQVSSVLSLKVDKSVEPLAANTQFTVRQRSNLGLKYLELIPGNGRQTVPDGGTLPESQSQPVVDLQDVLNVFDAKTRQGVRGSLQGIGDGLAGRGEDLNVTIQSLPALFGDLEAVTHNLNAPATGLGSTIASIASGTEAIAPESATLAELFGQGAVTFAALASQASAIAHTLESAPSTEAVGAQALRTISPVLGDTRQLLVTSAPGIDVLAGSSSQLAAALRAGTPALDRTPGFADRLGVSLGSLGTLARDPSTTVTLEALSDTLTPLLQTLSYANPFQTQCNYLGLWGRNVSSTISEGDDSGTWFRAVFIVAPAELLAAATPASSLHVQTYADEGQNGQCTFGNEVYAPGQQIGPAPGTYPDATESTAPPPGTPIPQNLPGVSAP